MNTPTPPPPLHLDGSPAFDLDPAAPWPVPESKPVVPQTMREIVLGWIERKLA